MFFLYKFKKYSFKVFKFDGFTSIRTLSNPPSFNISLILLKAKDPNPLPLNFSFIYKYSMLLTYPYFSLIYIK